MIQNDNDVHAQGPLDFDEKWRLVKCMDHKKGREHLIGAEEQRLLSAKYVAMSPLQKMQLTGDLYLVERHLFEIGFRCLYPEATNDDIVNGYMKVTLGPELYAEVMAYKKEHQISA